MRTGQRSNRHITDHQGFNIWSPCGERGENSRAAKKEKKKKAQQTPGPVQMQLTSRLTLELFPNSHHSRLSEAQLQMRVQLRHQLGFVMG
jgi:predicted alpha/beta superfamily hydrolase